MADELISHSWCMGVVSHGYGRLGRIEDGGDVVGKHSG